jgi:hypothetical protein
MPEKNYTPEEVSALLGRAARLQATGDSSEHSGLTLAEIKAAAAEAGIDPRFVEMATSEPSDHRSAYWGIPTGAGLSLFVRRVLTDDRWRRMVAVFTRQLGGPGTTDAQGSCRSWSRGSLRVTAEEGGSQVVLHAETAWEKELELPIVLTLVGVILAATTGAAALVSLEWTLGLVAVLTAILVVGFFSAYRRRTAARQEQLRRTFESTLDRCAAILHEEAQADVEADVEKIDGVAARMTLPARVRTGASPRDAVRCLAVLFRRTGCHRT